MVGDRSQGFRRDSDPLTPKRDSAEDRICVKCKGRIVFLCFHEIHWIAAAGNYLELHTGMGTYMVRDTMADFASRLDVERFVRIHRSAIVNVQYIRELKPWYTGEYVLTLTSGKELTLSRKYRSSLDRITAKGGCAKQTGGASDILAIAVNRECGNCKAPLDRNPAFACVHDCTFCEQCASQLRHVCPICGGTLSYRRLLH